MSGGGGGGGGESRLQRHAHSMTTSKQSKGADATTITRHVSHSWADDTHRSSANSLSLRTSNTSFTPLYRAVESRIDKERLQEKFVQLHGQSRLWKQRAIQTKTKFGCSNKTRVSERPCLKKILAAMQMCDVSKTVNSASTWCTHAANCTELNTACPGKRCAPLSCHCRRAILWRSIFSLAEGTAAVGNKLSAGIFSAQLGS